MNASTKVALFSGVGVGVLAIIIAGAYFAQSAVTQAQTQATEVDKCTLMSEEIEKSRPLLDQKQAEYDQHLYEYNQEWFPSPSFTQQIEAESKALDQMYAYFNAAVDSYNALCAA